MGNRHCSPGCRGVERELEAAQRICEAVGAPALWAEAVCVSDAWASYHRELDRVREAARGVGITDEQWEAIKRGG